MLCRVPRDEDSALPSEEHARRALSSAWQSAPFASERPWVQIPQGPHLFFFLARKRKAVPKEKEQKRVPKKKRTRKAFTEKKEKTRAKKKEAKKFCAGKITLTNNLFYFPGFFPGL